MNSTLKVMAILMTASSLTVIEQKPSLADSMVLPVDKVLQSIESKPPADQSKAPAEKTGDELKDIPKVLESQKPKAPTVKTPNKYYDELKSVPSTDTAKLKELYNKAIEEFDKTGTRDDRYAVCMSDLAEMELKEDNLASAEARIKKSLDASTDHEITSSNYHLVGDIKTKQNRLTEAEAAYGGAVDIFTKYGDPRHQQAIVLEKLAAVYDREGRTDQARATRLKATDLATFEAGNKGAQSAYKLGTKALIANDYTEAIKQFELALKAQADFKAAKMNLAICYQHEALEHQQKKEYSQAEANYLQALPAMEAAFGPKHAYTCTVLQGLTETYESENKLDDAEKFAQQWVEIEREAHKLSPPMFNALKIYSRVLKANKKSDQAVAIEKELSDMEAKDKASKPQFSS